MTFEYVYVWWRLSISIQEALLLIPKLRQSHQTGCLLKSFTRQLSIPFICQPSCLYMFFIKWLHLLSKPTYCPKHRACDASEIMHRNPRIMMLYMALSPVSTMLLSSAVKATVMLITRLSKSLNKCSAPTTRHVLSQAVAMLTSGSQTSQVITDNVYLTHLVADVCVKSEQAIHTYRLKCSDSRTLLFSVNATWLCSSAPPAELNRLKRCPAPMQGKVEKGSSLCSFTQCEQPGGSQSRLA